MRSRLLGVIAVLCAAGPAAADDFFVRIHSGADDLRGGNSAWIRFLRTSGTMTPDILLSRGLAGFARADVSYDFDDVSAANLQAIVIRHDGNPRSGHPFDTYDNWDLAKLLIIDGTTWRILYDHRLDPSRFSFVHRFTGESRELRIDFVAPAGQADFVLATLRRSGTRVEYSFRNQGTATGRALGFTCRNLVTGSSVTVRSSVTLAPGQVSAVMRTEAVSGQLACWVQDVENETLTGNNGQWLPP